MTPDDHRDRAGAPARALRVARLLGALALGGLLAAAAGPRTVEATGALEFFQSEQRAAQPRPAEPSPQPGAIEQILGNERRAAPGARPQPVREPTRSANARRFARSSGSRTMCVRMCDGYYFPIGDLQKQRDLPLHDLSCNAACPGAPTKLFVLPPGANAIAEARAADGMLYGDLPMAQVYTRSIDRTCSCQGPNGRVAERLDIRHDMTLRRGDIIVTTEGPLVYRGADGRPGDMAEFRPFGEAQLTDALRGKADERLGVSFRERIEREFLATSRATVDLATR